MNRFLIGSAAAATVALTACGAKDGGKTDTTTPAQAAAPAAPASMASFDPATHVAVIHAKEFSFDTPDSITAGWTTFHFVNDGAVLHHAQLVRLDSGKTVAELPAALEAAFKANAPPPKWIVDVGGPNAVDPSGSADATVNLEPGQYAFLCFVDMPDKVMHFTKGMVRALKVTAGTAPPAPEPTSDVVINLTDYAFTIQGALTAGKHTFKIVNKGPQVHEIQLIRLAPGKTAKDLMAFMTKMEGPPPANALGGVAGFMPGMTAYTTADLTPGNYLLLCFVPDAKDGKAHFAHGMTKEFTVK
jgi:uncharacterized cupredoxin-like copper-binding protein